MLKKLLLKILFNCQENTSAGATLLIRIGWSCRPATIFIKKETLALMFSWEYRETPILQNNYELLLLLLLWRLQINRWKILLDIFIVTCLHRVFCTKNAASKSIILSCIIFFAWKIEKLLNSIFQRMFVFRFLLVLFFVII